MPGGVHPPLSVIASWPTPNYKNPTTSGWELVVTSVVLGTLAIVTVAARLYARIVLIGKAGWEDWLIVIAMVSARIFAGSSIGMSLIISRFQQSPMLY